MHSSTSVDIQDQLKISQSVKRRVKANKEERRKKGKVFVTKDKMIDLIEKVNKKEEEIVQQKIQKQMEWWEAMTQRDAQKETKSMIKKNRIQAKKDELRSKRKPSSSKKSSS